MFIFLKMGSNQKAKSFIKTQTLWLKIFLFLFLFCWQNGKFDPLWKLEFLSKSQFLVKKKKSFCKKRERSSNYGSFCLHYSSIENTSLWWFQTTATRNLYWLILPGCSSCGLKRERLLLVQASTDVIWRL